MEHQRGYDAIASGPHSDSESIQMLWYTDPFATLAIKPTSNLSITPGLRYNYNSLYGSHLIWSSTVNHKFDQGFDIKLIAGSAYKTPNFSQLFYDFIDSNHYVVGNKNLDPEDGFSLMFNADKTYRLGDVQLKYSVQAYHYNIKKKISQVQVLVDTLDNTTSETTPIFITLNTDTYKNYGFTLKNILAYRNLNWVFGATYNNAHETFASATEDATSSTWSVTSQTTYDVPGWAMQLGLFVKYNGPDQQFYQNGDTLEPGELESYTMVDASVKKSFFDNSFGLTLGARNLLNVVTINADGLTAGGGHDGVNPTTQFFSTGRSWFMKLSYKISSKS